MTLVKHHNHPFKNGNSIFNGFFGDDFFRQMTKESHRTVPSANIAETKESFLIELAVPGLKKEDFKVHLEKHLLTVSMKVEEKVEQEGTDYQMREFNFEQFERSFRLPKTVNVEGIAAKYEAGVLTLTLPKLEEAIDKGPREIAIG